MEGLEDLEQQYGFNFIETIRATLSSETKEAIMSLHQKNEEGEVRGVKLRLLARMLKEAIIHANKKESIDELMNQMLREGKLLEGEDMTELQNDIAF